MSSVQIQPESLHFLTDLAANNQREWFQEHRPRYDTAHANMVDFAGELHEALKDVDNIEPRKPNKVLFRIYRDVRFSKNKAPYKNHWSGGFKRATAALRGGYYFHIMPGGSFVAGGFWGPNSADLKRIRMEIDLDAAPLREIIESEEVQSYFGGLTGEKLKTAPQGFPKDHPDIDLLRYKQFILVRNFPDEVVLGADFIEQIVDTYEAMHPFFDFMSEVLTTDTNGRSILPNEGE